MEKTHKCKYCSREFASGKALGGHVRAHVMKLKNRERIEEEAEGVGQIDEYDSRFYLSNEDEGGDDEEDEEYWVDLNLPEVIQDGENGTKVSMMVDTPPCRRSKRMRKLTDCYYNSSKVDTSIEKARKGERTVMDDYSGINLSSDTITVEEQCAHSLIELSRHNLGRDNKDWGCDYNDGRKRKLDENFDSSSKSASKMYKCEECDKMFYSHQALGGHKANHHKIKFDVSSKESELGPTRKMYKCPFCYRLFASGQALGGHKRSHLAETASSSSDAADTTDTIGSSIGQLLNIDMNLPAPLEDGNNNQNEASTMTNAKCVLVIKK